MTFKGKTKVDVSSYANFKNTILGNAYDVDNYAGYQCYDLANLFWINACNRWVISATADGGVKGGASGIWGARNTNNKGDEFELITDVNALKQGDIIITNNGTYGHISFLDSDGCVLGQNQGNTHGAVPGAECKVIKWDYKKYFLGAFRFKKWVKEEPKPSTEINVGDIVTVSGRGNASSSGTSRNWTRNYTNKQMKVILVSKGAPYPYACNQYGEGKPGRASDVTGWFAAKDIKK